MGPLRGLLVFHSVGAGGRGRSSRLALPGPPLAPLPSCCTAVSYNLHVQKRRCSGLFFRVVSKTEISGVRGGRAPSPLVLRVTFSWGLTEPQTVPKDLLLSASLRCQPRSTAVPSQRDLRRSRQGTQLPLAMRLLPPPGVRWAKTRALGTGLTQMGAH